MKRIPAIIAVVLSLPFAAHAAPVRYTLDPNHTNIDWHVDHLGFSTVSGKFVTSKGTLVLDEDDPAKSSIEAEIRTDSILTGLPKFDEHLKGMDFFNVAQYPRARFKSTRVEMTGKDTATVHGQFTMLGNTMPLTLDVKLNKIGEHPMNQKKVAGFSAVAVIQRSDHGMTYGLPMVGNKVRVTIEAEASPEEEAKE